jgi:hypothetical protein
MHGEDRLDAIARDLYDAYQRSAAETGWHTITSKLSYAQQAEGIRQLWRRMATRAAILFAEQPSVN